MYEVHWTPRGINTLAEICLNHASEWQAINAAEENIADKLMRNPLTYSHEVSEGLRRIISSPLVVYFTIEGNRVQIDAVGWMR
jgi:hypothetical protein